MQLLAALLFPLTRASPVFPAFSAFGFCGLGSLWFVSVAPFCIWCSFWFMNLVQLTSVNFQLTQTQSSVFC